jgi:low temperature requirement protein LtrA
VTNTELFFDLVYVFAVTQLSHLLLGHLTGRGALETGVLLAAVWWAWNSTAWATNWVDPDQPPVRVLLIGLMLLGLIMSAAIPEAFRSRGLEFAVPFVAMGLVRGGFMVYALRGSRMGRNSSGWPRRWRGRWPRPSIRRAWRGSRTPTRTGSWSAG